MLNFMLERFKKLPRQPGAIWQGGVFRMPAWVKRDDGKPFRPMMALWADANTGIVAEPHYVEKEEPFQTALDALVDFGLRTGRKGHRPLAIEVKDAELAEFLEGRLIGTGVRVDCIASLPAIQAFLDDFAETMNKREEPPAALSGMGVDIEQMRSFAEAAVRFFDARPWEELSDEDLIAVEDPAAPPGMAYVSVLGHGSQAFGLGFFASLNQYEKSHTAASPGRFLSRDGVWSLTFGDVTELPFADADLWEGHQLPVKSDDGYPSVFWYGPKKQVRRPNANELGFLGGLLHALAVTTHAELDRGRWTRKVKAGDREVEFRLALVHESAAKDDRPRLPIDHQDVRRAMEKNMAALERLMANQDFESLDDVNAFVHQNLNSMESIAPPPGTPLEQAQEIMYEAWDARGRRRRVLARKALDLSPDCADAYVMLAEESGGPSEALKLYQQGVEAGERALGAEFFEKEAGRFWGLVETRPYMRARFGLAQCLWALGRNEDAVTHYEELLRLNPGDNQGVRYLLAACLLEINDDERLDKLIRQYDDEITAQWMYVRALWSYRREGDSKTARKRAREAVKSNAYVPAFLSGRRRLPARLPDGYRLGHEDEAMICAAELRDKWRATPGAIEWLAKVQGSRGRR